MDLSQIKLEKITADEYRKTNSLWSNDGYFLTCESAYGCAKIVDTIIYSDCYSLIRAALDWNRADKLNIFDGRFWHHYLTARIGEDEISEICDFSRISARAPKKFELYGHRKSKYLRRAQTELTFAECTLGLYLLKVHTTVGKASNFCWAEGEIPRFDKSIVEALLPYDAKLV